MCIQTGLTWLKSWERVIHKYNPTLRRTDKFIDVELLTKLS